MQFLLNILVSRLVSNGESQAQSCVLINGTAPVLTAHATDGSKTCTDKRKESKIRCAEYYILGF